MLLRMIYDDRLAQASYLVGCQASGDALVIDPNRNIDQYLELAQRHELRITAVTETHIHADFASGARELAAKTGAKLYLSAEGGKDWQYSFAKQADAVLVHDGDSFKVGNIKLQVLHTPGHTPEHISFMVTDTAAADEPMGVFTGDFVFVGDIGRPDLLEKAAGITNTMEAGARDLYRSVQTFKKLPDYLQIWPGHGAGSACGKALGAVPQSTLGYEKRFNSMFVINDEQTFVDTILDGQPAPPTYFAAMKKLNKQGAPDHPALVTDHATVHELEVALNENMTLVDVRNPDEYAAEYIHGTINILMDDSFANWAGWLVPTDATIGLIGAPHATEQAQRILQTIGADGTKLVWDTTIVTAWYNANKQTERYERKHSTDVAPAINDKTYFVLDVRNPDEYAEGRIAGSVNIPLGQLSKNLAALPKRKQIVVHCEGGGRSPIAASLLKQQGFNVVEMRDGMTGWRREKLPVEVG